MDDTQTTPQCRRLDYIMMKKKLPTSLPETLAEQLANEEKLALSEALIAMVSLPNGWRGDFGLLQYLQYVPWRMYPPSVLCG